MNDWDSAFYDRETWREQVGENSARLAFAWGTASTLGAGSKPYEDVIKFGLAFAEKPMFSYGYEVLNRTDFEADDYANNLPAVPISTGCIYEWDVDGRGMWIGAHVAVYTVCADDVEIEHHFGFTGLAIKDVGSGVKLGQ